MNRTKHRSQDEVKKIRRGAYIKIVAAVGFIAAVLAYGTISWFTMNKENNASGMGVKTATIPFELSSTGSAPAKYLSLFGLTDSNYGQGTRQGNTNEYQSNGSSKLMWRLNSDDPSSYTDGFRPGASGTLTFDIIPNISDEFYVDCKFNIRTFVAEYAEDDEEEETPISIEEVNVTTGGDDEKAGYRYLNGHILFFQEKSTVGEDDEYTIYTGYIGTDGLKVHIPANSSGEAVTVYWKWVNTFDQLLLKSTDSYDDYPLLADENTSDRTKAINYIKANYNNMFSDISTANSALIPNIDYAYVKANPTLLSDLSDNYNTADQVIGLNIDYFLLEMSAERGNPPATN